MPNSLKSKLSKLRYQGKITDEEYRELIYKLEGHDEAITAQIKWERDTAIEQLKQLGYGLGEKVEPCEDYISRQAVLDKKELVELEDGQSFYCINPEDVETLQPVTPQQKWIPVSEKLPEKNGIYIASYEDAVALLNWFNGKWFFYPSNPAREETGTIIAWMPLPEPYKEDSNE